MRCLSHSLAGLNNQELRPNVQKPLLCQAEQNRAQRTLVSISGKELTATPSGGFRSNESEPTQFSDPGEGSPGQQPQVIKIPASLKLDV